VTAIPEIAREFLKTAPLAHVVTIGSDGRPQLSVVWIKVDRDDLVIASLGPNQKLKNLRRDPQIAVSFESKHKNEMGIHEYLVVHGTATIEEGGAADVLQELAYSYMGPGVKFPPMDSPPDGYLIRIRVDRIGGVGPWMSMPNTG
jgi:PPOX class probable F420-dependent enzyme